MTLVPQISLNQQPYSEEFNIHQLPDRTSLETFLNDKRLALFYSFLSIVFLLLYLVAHDNYF